MSDTLPVTEPSALHRYVLDPLERAVSTFAQQFVWFILPAVTGGGALAVTQNWVMAADAAGFAALVSLLTSILTFMVPKLPPGPDLLLRVVKTFVQSFVGTMTAAAVTPSLLHFGWRGALAAAIPVALTALLKGLASLAAPWSDGASLLPTNYRMYLHPADDVYQSYEWVPDVASTMSSPGQPAAAAAPRLGRRLNP